MKATELLQNQHREIEQLFEQLESVEHEDKKIVREELARNLVGHMVIEEEQLYPAMRGAMRETIDRAQVEHESARYALAQLLSASPDDERFAAKALVLEQLFRTHVNEEEREILPRAESVIGADQLAQINRKMDQRFEQLLGADVEGVLRQMITREAPAMLSPRTAPRTRAKATAKKRPARAAQAKKTPKRAAQTKRGAAAAATPRRTAPARGATTKRGTRKRTASSRASR